MGINGLLPAFKGICRPSHISKYRGEKVAVDGYSWLHKGAYCCSRELCEGVWTDRWVWARGAPLRASPAPRQVVWAAP
jgi:exonuclease-1